MLTTCLLMLWGSSLQTVDANSPVKTAVDGLNSPTAQTRLLALRRLAKLPADKAALEPLLSALTDSDSTVRLEAVKAWGSVGNDYDRLENRLLRRQSQYKTFNDGWNYRFEQHRAWMERLFASLKANALDGDSRIRRAS